MSEQQELRDIEVRRIGSLRKNAGGHPYLEAETNEGVAAFWGFGEETSNIAAMQQMILVAELRNSKEHDREPFTDLQTGAGRAAWQAITSWLESTKPEQ